VYRMSTPVLASQSVEFVVERPRKRIYGALQHETPTWKAFLTYIISAKRARIARLPTINDESCNASRRSGCAEGATAHILADAAAVLVRPRRAGHPINTGASAHLSCLWRPPQWRLSILPSVG
jgi:hypothetical protein